eukprot:c19366_g1_i1 orf=224-3553(-)
MAMGMHVPAPIPRLRRGACPSSPSSLPGGVGCLSYRWHSVDCAVSTDIYSGVPDFKTSQSPSTDEEWSKNAQRERDRVQDRMRLQQTCLSGMEMAATVSEQGGVLNRPHVIADNYHESRNASGDAQPSFETSELAERVMAAGLRIRDSTSYATKMMYETRFQTSLASTDLMYGEANKWEHIDGACISSNVAVLDRPLPPVTSTVSAASSSRSRAQKLDQMALACSEIIAASEDQDRDEHFAGVSVSTKPRDRAEHTDHAILDSGSGDRNGFMNQVQNPKSSQARSEMAEDPSTTGGPMVDLIETASPPLPETMSVLKKVARLACAIEDVFVVDNFVSARSTLDKLRGEYKDFIHACDTEVSDIDVKKESPVGHGKVICFSIYCGPEADFGDGKSCVWVDVLDSNEELLNMFKEYFEDSSIKKVWHNFSFDRHVLANHGIRAAGFYADTMHLARLWHSGRKGAEGSYSLESLTSDLKAMNGVHDWDAQTLTKKTSMVELFGSNKLRKDGKEGSTRVVPPVEELQRSESLREKWICYSSGDALCTWRLWESLHEQLKKRDWYFQNEVRGSMYNFYCRFWRPFGELLAEMEGHGMLVDREYLAEIEKVACKERAISISRFRKWAAKYSSNAQYINVTSDAQIRQLLFGGFKKVSKCRTFKIPNSDGYIEEGKKAPLKYRSMELCGIGVKLPCDMLTSGGLPAVSMQALKSLAGKVSVDCTGMENEEFIPGDTDAVLTSEGLEGSEESRKQKQEDISAYGQAYHAFNGGQEGKEACKAIAALCEVSAIDTLISGFIQPLQGGDIMGPDSRVHCSLNLNTETGRLSARRPNLQNQPALEKDRYKIRQAFIASPGNLLIVADYGQLELRLLAHLADCKSMLEAFKVGGDFHSRTAMNMYSNVKEAVEKGEVLLEWEPKPGEDSPHSPLLKDVYGAERRKAKMLNFSIAYGKTAKGLAKDWKVSMQEAHETVNLWYRDRPEVRKWQEAQKRNARQNQCVYTLLGRPRHFPDVNSGTEFLKGRIDRAAINTPVQGSAADVAMLAMLEIGRSTELKELGWKLLLQVHDEMILEGPADSAAHAKDLVVKAMSHPFQGKNILKVDLVVDAKYASSWYAAK